MGFQIWGKRTPDYDAVSWPKDERGEPVSPAFLLHSAELDLEASMTAGMLKAFGIPTLRQYPNDGDFAKIILGVPAGGVDIYVPETMLSMARDIFSAEICGDDEQPAFSAEICGDDEQPAFSAEICGGDEQPAFSAEVKDDEL